MKRVWVTVWLAFAFALGFAPGCRSGAVGDKGMSAFDSGTESASSSRPETVTAPATAPPPAANVGTTTAPTTTSVTPTPSAEAPEVPAAVKQRRMFVDKAELGQPAPDFQLRDVNGKSYRLSKFKGRAVVLEWFNPRCSYCIELYKEGGVLREMPEHWVSEGAAWFAINSQGPEDAGSSVEENIVFRRENGSRSPLLMDPTGVVGKAYGVKMTPQVFVISERGVLVYRGALDNAPNGVVPPRDVKTNYVDAALRDLRSGRAVTINVTNAYGCPVGYAKP